MKKIEKAMQIVMETLEERIVKKDCPHNYGMTDKATSSDFMCDGDCRDCWNEEVKDDKT